MSICYSLAKLRHRHDPVLVNTTEKITPPKPSVRRFGSVSASVAAHPRICDLTLTIKPGGPVAEVTHVSIPYRVYRSVQPGDAVCLVLRERALGIPWYTAQICPWDGAAVRLGFFRSSSRWK